MSTSTNMSTDKDQSGNTTEVSTLIYHIKTENIEAIYQCLSNGQAADGVVSDEYPPLHEAVFQNNLNICKILIEHKADVNQRDKYNCTS